MGAFVSGLFWIGISVAAAIITTILVTLTTRFRLWPPGNNPMKAALHWGFVGVFNLVLINIAVLRWNSWVLARPTSLIVGLLGSILGATIFAKSTRAMSTAETSGRVANQLYTDGLYARSRNPQYVGMIIGLVGFAFLINSWEVAVLCLVHVGWLLLLPFAEEPWLRDQFGGEYDRYSDRVPRFIGLRTVHLR